MEMDAGFLLTDAEDPAMKGGMSLLSRWLSANTSLSITTHEWKENQGMEELDLRRQRLRALPDDMVFSFKKLCVLNLSYNEFEEWPQAIHQLVFLECLYMNGNRLKKIDGDLGALSCLRFLFLSENQLIELPDTISDLISLERLILGSIYGGNDLISLPETMGNLKFLKELDVSYNKLKELPESMGSLQSLQTLSCFQNQLERIPASLSECKQLKSIDLGRNRLKEIPSALVSDLKELEYMSLVENQLESLPSEILDRRDMTVLISGNRFLEEPISTYGGEVETQMPHVPSLLELSARAIVRYKILLSYSSLPLPLALYLKCVRSCSRCRGPMFGECLRSISVSEYLGHPCVPKKSHLCSPKCLIKCKQKFMQSINW
jgi:Leucine-rich repeat (LRR) protein